MEPQNPDPATLQNLEDAGCDESTVECYCELERQLKQAPQGRKAQILLLARHRKALLNQMHACQRKLDCLDYLLYKLKGEAGERKGVEKAHGHDR